jgi:hypothetical protein
MARDFILFKVAIGHALLLCVLLAGLSVASQPIDGALLGGGLAALAFGAFWVLATSITNPRRRGLGRFLGSLKMIAYFALIVAALTGKLVIDPAGFALGVTCFIVAVMAAALGSSVSHQTA